MPLWLAPFGLALDIVGVIVLTIDAAETYGKTLEAIGRAATRSGGLSVETIRKMKRAGWKATWAGLGLVLFGFLLQFLAGLDTVF